MSNTTNLTKTLVENHPTPAKDVFIWDSKLTGFGVRIKPSGKKSYLIQYRNQHGKSRRITIGDSKAIGTDAARQLAKEKLYSVMKGNDPANDKSRIRSTPNLTEFAHRYLTDHADLKKKARSAASDRQYLDNNILPKLGKKLITEIDRKDISALHTNMKDTPTAANRALSLLSKMMNLAEAWEIRPDGTNPCRHVQKYPERSKERFLNNAEIKRLGESLAKFEDADPFAIYAIKLLLLTGARLSEILNLRWDQVDTRKGIARLDDAKTGPRDIYLNPPAIDILTIARAKTASEFVIPGRDPSKPRNTITKRWNLIRKDAELEDVRIHDLRHTHASTAAGLGLSLTITGKLLGHTQAQTTQRYAHLDNDPIHNASKLVGDTISNAINGNSS